MPPELKVMQHIAQSCKCFWDTKVFLLASMDEDRDKAGS